MYVLGKNAPTVPLSQMLSSCNPLTPLHPSFVDNIAHSGFVPVWLGIELGLLPAVSIIWRSSPLAEAGASSLPAVGWSL